MFDKVVFYCHYGNGDLLISKEFVREIIQKIPAKEYYYAHAKNSRMFADITQLKHTNITDNMQMRRRVTIIDNCLYLNTWLGVDSTFVTPANSCSIYNSLRMYNYMLSTSNLGVRLTQPMEDYIPKIDYKYFNISSIDEFINQFYWKKLVLIANCQAQSGQADNFDFSVVVSRLCDTFKDIFFIVTDKVNVDVPNLFLSSNITKSKDGFDLNEMAYLSLFCNPIIGRSSGAQIFAMNRDNMMNSNKTFVSFTYRIEASSIVWGQRVKASVVWSSGTENDEVYSACKSVIDGGIQ